MCRVLRNNDFSLLLNISRDREIEERFVHAFCFVSCTAQYEINYGIGASEIVKWDYDQVAWSLSLFFCCQSIIPPVLSFIVY